MARDREKQAVDAFKRKQVGESPIGKSPRRELGELTPRDWFVLDRGADQVARRMEVWSLLGWYHHNHVRPYLGFVGMLRWLWRRLTQPEKLLSPWELLEKKLQAIEAGLALQRQMGIVEGDQAIQVAEESGAAPEGGRIITP